MASIFDKFRTPDDPKAQRIRRSEVLLSQLYRSEIAPRLELPPIKGARVLAILSVVALIVFVSTLVYQVNQFIGLKEEAFAKGGNLQAALQRRDNLVGNLVRVTLGHATLEHEVFTHAANMRAELMKQIKIPLSALGAAAGAAPGSAGAAEWTEALKSLLGDGGVDSSLGRLLGVVEQYPDIKSSGTYQELMSSLMDIENLIAERRLEYHKTVREYNVAVTNFPWRILADLTGYERMPYFELGKDPQAVGPAVSAMGPEVSQGTHGPGGSSANKGGVK